MQDVATATGRVRGSEALSGVHVWRGIPYAAPPVGLLRWRAPQPVRPWGGTRDALHFGPDFPQVPNPASRADSMSEDCLYLNLWAPADATSGSLPVMLWFTVAASSRGAVQTRVATAPCWRSASRSSS
jgi:para-nitrobenzyl esterase